MTISDIKTAKPSAIIDNEGYLRDEMKSETEACNSAAQMVGTFAKQDFTASVCNRGRCQQEAFHSAKIIGGAIAVNGHQGRKLISQLNEYSAPGSSRLRDCELSLSWDSNTDTRRSQTYKESWDLPGKFNRHHWAGESNLRGAPTAQ